MSVIVSISSKSRLIEVSTYCIIGPIERPDRFACRNCKKSGHSSKECPEPRSAEGVECKKCNEGMYSDQSLPNSNQLTRFLVGHFAKGTFSHHEMLAPRLTVP